MSFALVACTGEPTVPKPSPSPTPPPPVVTVPAPSTTASAPAASPKKPPLELRALPLQRHPAFEKMARGELTFSQGDEDPAIAVIQGMLYLWNYNLEVADVHGRFDDKTNSALRSYGLDLGMFTEPPAKVAIDRKLIETMQGRMEAVVYRQIEDVVVKKGLRFRVPHLDIYPPPLQRRSMLERAFPIGNASCGEETAATWVIETTPNEDGSIAFWIPLADFRACDR